MADLARNYFTATDGKPLLYYCVYGEFTETIDVETSSLKGDGLPAGVDAVRFTKKEHPEEIGDFLSGYVGSRLEASPALAAEVTSASQMLRVLGEVEDQPTLEYLGQTIDVVTAIASQCGVGILDPQTFSWWSVEEWRKAFFPFRVKPREHVEIFKTRDSEGKFWYRTRGLRKFGRHDIGVSSVPDSAESLVVEIIDRFIDWQALGGVVADGQELRVPGAPAGLVCRRVGSLEDDDYNNFHIAIQWP